MATVTAAPPESPTAARLWQVPAFLVGLAAFLAAWQGWLPLGQRDPSAAFLADLAALREAAGKPNASRDEIRGLVDRVSKAAEGFPEHGPAAHFALGSGYVRLAELTPDPAEAQTAWALAYQHFDALKPDQAPPDPADQSRLTFRAAKARAATLGPNATAGQINQTRSLLGHVPLGEPPGEAYRLVAELALRLNPPDANGAKAALIAYIGGADLATPPSSIVRAKLRLSEVHLLLGESDQARKWLSQIGPDAPPDVLAPAKAQLARILMSEGDWAGAVKEWEIVRAAPGLPPGLKSLSAYYLGVCRLMTRPPDPAAAAKLFEEAAKADGPEGPASAVRLADLHFRSPDANRHRAAAGLLTAAIKKLTGPTGYSNPLLPITETQAAFELGLQALLTDGAFETAAQLAETYKAVALPGRDREKRAEVLAAWGESLKKSGGDFKPKLAAAADEYLTLAAAQPQAEGKADLLRRAAGLYRQAGNSKAAIAALEQVVALPDLPDAIVGPVWLEYAEVLTVAHPDKPEEVIRAFNKAMAAGGPAGMTTRYKLARSLLDTRDPRMAPLGLALLEQVAGQTSVGPAEAETHERALVELAYEYIQARNYQEAEARLSIQLSRYPTGPEAGLAKLLKGICLLQMAAAKAKPTDPDPPLAPKMRQDALKLFREIVEDVEKREKIGPVSDRDRWLWVQASIRICQTHLELGQPDEVLKAAAPVIERHRGTVYELIVLSLIWHAHKQAERPDLQARTKERMREVFNQLKDKPGAFQTTNNEYSREYWERVWFTDKK
jgi:tetratricopeptide (TPR) repeat protein